MCSIFNAHFCQEKRFSTCAAIDSIYSDSHDDSLSFPADSILYATVTDRLRFGCGHDDFDSFFIDSDSSVIERLKSLNGRKKTSSMSLDESIKVIAWQKVRIQKQHTFNKRDWIFYNVLVWCKYKNVFGNTEWALVCVIKDEDLGEAVPWRLLCGRDGDPVRRYAHAPTNSDVMTSIDRSRSVGQHFFLGEKNDMDRSYGIPIQFVDGDVREKTWEAVIGEKPTRFFPNGK